MIDNAELQDIPGTKAMLLSDPARTVDMLPFGNWVKDEKTIPSIVVDQKVVSVTVTN